MSEVQEINVGGSVFDVKDKSAMTLALNNKVGAKNLIPYPYVDGTTKTASGVTYTVNADGTISTSGTSTGRSTFMLANDIVLPTGRYIVTGCPSEGGETLYHIAIRYAVGSESTYYLDIGDGLELTVGDNSSLRIWCVTDGSGINMSGKVFKPMLRFAEDTDDTYEPYAMTNRGLTTSLMQIQRPLNPNDIITTISDLSSYVATVDCYACVVLSVIGQGTYSCNVNLSVNNVYIESLGCTGLATGVSLGGIRTVYLRSGDILRISKSASAPAITATIYGVA